MYRFAFTTITPIHISNGEVLHQNFHYTILDGKMHKIDPIRLAGLLAENERINFASKDFERWIEEHQPAIVDKANAYSIKVHESFERYFKNSRADGTRQVVEFINVSGQFYIPASSVKGSLLTPLGEDFLGINPRSPDINDRVVFYDSAAIPAESFSVYRTENRPPQINLICLDPGIRFTLTMRKAGRFDKDMFLNKLTSYTNDQLTNVERKVADFRKKGKVTKADLFLKSINEIRNLVEQGQPVINIGFGGGSWFKTSKDKIPMFRARGKGSQEPAHSSFSFKLNGELHHIGWCKLEIEEI